MDFRLVFHKAGIDGKVTDNAISIWTGLFPVNWGTKGYSHVEIWYHDKDGVYVSESGEIRGECFSSTTRGGATGVRKEPACMTLRNPERWDVTDRIEAFNKFAYVRAVLEKEIGKPYDFQGVSGFVIPGKKDDPDKWYCSEIVAYALWLYSVLEDLYSIISPRRLSKIVIKEGYSIEPLTRKGIVCLID